MTHLPPDHQPQRHDPRRDPHRARVVARAARRDEEAGARTTLLLVGLLAALLVVTAVAGLGAGRAQAAGRWAPAATAAIHPGVQMYTKGAQCTANFVYTDARGRTYVGYAAHCAGTGASTDTNGCQTRSVPLGTRVRFADQSTDPQGATVGHGRLVYSSWRTMRARGESRGPVCAYNDLALVRVAKADVAKVNPSVPQWGGPVGLATKQVAQGGQVYTWGQSSLRPGTVLSPKTGLSLGPNTRWSTDVYTVTPGIPGDSGSGLLDASGRAVGTLSTVQLAPTPGSNGFGTLALELAYAQKHSGIAGLRLVKGTEPFAGLG